MWALGKDGLPERVISRAISSGLARRAGRPSRDNRIVIMACSACGRAPGSRRPTGGSSRPWQLRSPTWRFSQLFIDRPDSRRVISVIIMLVGGVAYVGFPVAEFRGRSSEHHRHGLVSRRKCRDRRRTVASPLEQEINGVENMLYLSSQSTSDGRTTITVTFALGTDLDIAQVLVQNRVNIALPRLPEEVRRLGVVTNKNTPDILMVVHVYSPDNSRDQLYLSNYTLLNIRDRVARLEGSGDLRLIGAREYTMRVWLDPNRISALGLTAGEVVRALRAQNVQVAGGCWIVAVTKARRVEVGVQLLGRSRPRRSSETC